MASVGLAAKESRDIELVVLARIMHRSVAAMRVEAVRPAAARIFRDRLGRAAFGMSSAGALRRTLILRHWPRRPRYWRRRRCLGVHTAAETD